MKYLSLELCALCLKKKKEKKKLSKLLLDILVGEGRRNIFFFKCSITMEFHNDE